VNRVTGGIRVKRREESRNRMNNTVMERGGESRNRRNYL
jgi:hypothetical protein